MSFQPIEGVEYRVRPARSCNEAIDVGHPPIVMCGGKLQPVEIVTCGCFPVPHRAWYRKHRSQRKISFNFPSHRQAEQYAKTIRAAGHEVTVEPIVEEIK